MPFLLRLLTLGVHLTVDDEIEYLFAKRVPLCRRRQARVGAGLSRLALCDELRARLTGSSGSGLLDRSGGGSHTDF
jgi:hypothetical protein